MIFNYVIYGDINKEGLVKISYYNKSIPDTGVSKKYLVTDKYQFNLGDFDLLGINALISKGDVCLIEYFNTDDIDGDTEDNKEYFSFVPLDTSVEIINLDIEVDSYTGNDDEANFTMSDNVVKTTLSSVFEKSSNLYNYYKIEEDVDDTWVLVREENKSLVFTPERSSKYKITQNALNNNNTVSSKEYEFNAIVSSATITRSNKCKGVNDSVKILFSANDDIKPTVLVIKDNEKDESGEMTDLGNNLFSYNYIFPSEGYYCFAVSYYDEVYLMDFKVKQSDLKVYYSDENHRTGLDLKVDYYSLDDLDNKIDTDTFTEIQDGIYGSSLLGLEYGDYLFNILDEEFVVSFEECAPVAVDNGLIGNSTETEEVYWIFSNR